MELTQRLECTQELFTNINETIIPEQIGFLGICGTKYPLKKGPNKIGRDPVTCNIVLNLDSISRQHAVINILNNNEYMLMDLDSSNKTKLSDKTLQPYIPHPLKNGDMVQFGQVFGVFRLFEEESDLPMTQAIEVPETPINIKHTQKINNLHGTTIPESPDVSDRDDSFIGASQPKLKNAFKSPNNNFIKSSGRTISIKPIGTNKIDNVYWSSSKKSDSFNMQSDLSNLDESITKLQTSDNSKNPQNIHELDTQVPFNNHDDSSESIYNANTQISENLQSNNFFNMDTQIPVTENLPEVYKIQSQLNVNFDFCTENKENHRNIFNAETQICDLKETISTSREDHTSLSSSKENGSMSDDVILFDEIDDKPLPDNFDSQPLLTEELVALNRELVCEEANSESINHITLMRKKRIESGSSTDCEDISDAATQIIPEKKADDDDSTDCEDEQQPSKESSNKKIISTNDDDSTDCEDDVTGNASIQPNKIPDNTSFEDLPTQIIEHLNVETEKDFKNKDSTFEDTPTQIIGENKSDSEKHLEINTNFEDLCTQIVEVVPNNALEKQNNSIDEVLTQKIASDDIEFKVPQQISVKKKKSDELQNLNKSISAGGMEDDDEKYYSATQDIFDDLCSQQISSPKQKNSVIITSEKLLGKNSTKKKNYLTDNLTQETQENNDIEEKINQFVSNLSCSQIRDVVGVQKVPETKDIKMSSSSSDEEITPKKINCRFLLETVLPNTQEINKSISLKPNVRNNEISSDESNESEHDSSDNSSYKSKKRKLNKIKINLSKKFNPDALPVRSSARIKKPSIKVQNCDEDYNSEDKILLIPKLSKTRGKKSNHENSLLPKTSKAQTNKIDRFLLKDIRHDIKQSESDTKVKSRTSRKNDVKDCIQIEETNNIKVDKDKIDKKSSGRGRKTKRSEGVNVSDEKGKQSKTNSDIEKSEQETVCDSRQTSTRSKRKNEFEKNKKSPEKVPKSNVNIDKKSNKSSKEIKHDTEVRRSTRSKTNKKSENASNNVSKVREQSTIYSIDNLSSDTSPDTPNKLKRSAYDPEFPIAKKIRNELESSVTSLRATPARKNKIQYVLFTAFPCEEVKHKLEKLGAVVVSDVMECSVVLTLQIKRTFKLLCAMGLGKPIVGPNWVQACVDTSMIVDPWLYLIKDEATEKRFQFNLHRTLSGRRDFLRGYNVSSTPGVMPSAPEMKMIVECSGGKWKEGGPNWVCVSASADKPLWSGLKKKGAIVVSTEFILGGVLRQKIDIDKCKLT